MSHPTVKIVETAQGISFRLQIGGLTIPLDVPEMMALQVDLHDALCQYTTRQRITRAPTQENPAARAPTLEAPESIKTAVVDYLDGDPETVVVDMRATARAAMNAMLPKPGCKVCGGSGVVESNGEDPGYRCSSCGGEG